MRSTSRLTGTAQPPLVSLLAHVTKAGELLSHLHQFALDSTGGSCSLLFQHNPRNGALQRDGGSLLAEFSASLSSTLNLAAGLDIFCFGANRLFGADRTSVWIHDRRARHLVLQASSDTEHVSRGMRVSASDPMAPAAA